MLETEGVREREDSHEGTQGQALGVITGKVRNTSAVLAACVEVES